MFLNIENEKIVGGDHSIRNGKEATVPDFAEEINYELIKRHRLGKGRVFFCLLNE